MMTVEHQELIMQLQHAAQQKTYWIAKVDELLEKLDVFFEIEIPLDVRQIKDSEAQDTFRMQEWSEQIKTSFKIHETMKELVDKKGGIK